MTDDRSLERAARSWLESGPTQAPPRAVETALLRIETTPQERVLRVPWRFSTMSMPARVAAAAVLGVLLVGGAFYTLWPNSQASVGGPAPSPTASPTVSPSPMSDAAFLAARNTICTDAAATLDPLKLRFVDDFSGTLTETQRDAWVAALTDFSNGYDDMIAKLAALPAPATIATEHAASVQDLRDMHTLIDTISAKLQARDDAAAGAADAATNPINARVLAFEDHYGYRNCP